MDCDSCSARKYSAVMRSSRAKMGILWQKPVCPWPPECPCFLFCTLCLLHGIRHGYCTGGHWTCGYTNIFGLCQTHCGRGSWGNHTDLSLSLEDSRCGCHCARRTSVGMSSSSPLPQQKRGLCKSNWRWLGRKKEGVRPDFTTKHLRLIPQLEVKIWGLLVYLLQLDYSRGTCWEAWSFGESFIWRVSYMLVCADLNAQVSTLCMHRSAHAHCELPLSQLGSGSCRSASL